MGITDRNLKIFVSAYACEPNLGSEIGVGWHWVLEMSKYFELWVLTRKSNQHSIEAWIGENPEFSNINFLYFDLPYYLRFWKKGLRGVRIYYNIWQWCTNRIVKKSMQNNGITIFHHLTYGNALWSVSKFGQKQFFIWGPTGGGEIIPREYTKHYRLKGRLIEALRRAIVKSLPFNKGFTRRCRNANLILCKTESHRNLIPNQYKNKATLFTDVAVDAIEFTNYPKKVPSSIVKYIVVGKLDPWRGFDLLIEAFDKAIKTNPNINLTIVGNGLDRKRLQKLIKVKNLSDYVKMVGRISTEEYYKLMKETDVVLNPSLKEGAVTTSFDSMALGKPLICIDTSGYTRYFSNEYAIVLPLQKRPEMIELLKDAILKLTNSNERAKLGKNAHNIGKQFTWQSRGIEIKELIEKSYNHEQSM
jgi:glycosyltransferase involved in cell wall biosynthesis